MSINVITAAARLFVASLRPPMAAAWSELPVVNGPLLVGQPATASAGAFDGTQPISVSYQWQRSDDGVTWADIAGQTALTHPSWDSGDEGDYIRCVVTASGPGGVSTMPSASLQVGSAGTALVFTTAPTLSTATPEAGSLIYSSTGLAPGNPSYAAQWLRDGVEISGATSWFYEIQEADIGADLSCRSTATTATDSATSTSTAYTVARAAQVAQISTYWPQYNTATRRYDLVPDASARVILVNGVGGGFQSGQIYHATTFTNALTYTRYNTGDWILMESGATSTAVLGDHSIGGNGIIGVSATYPACIGTFDPADPTNPAKWNRGPRHKIDTTAAGRNAVVLNLNRTGAAPRSNLAICNLWFYAGPEADSQDLNSISGFKGLLFDNCVFDGPSMGIQGFNGQAVSAVITGDNVTTVFNYTLRGRSDVADPFRVETLLTSQSSTTAYGTLLVKDVDYTITFGTETDGYYPSCQITLLAGALASTHKLKCSVSMQNQPVANLATDVVVNRCAMMYGNGWQGERGGSGYFYGVRRLNIQDCITHHGGWGRDHTRTTPSWYDPATLPGNGSNTSFAFPNARAKKSNLSNPWKVETVLTATGGSAVAMVSGTDYTIAFGSTDAQDIVQGCTITTTAPVAADRTLKISPLINGPDLYKHNLYIDDYIEDGVIWNTISSWDASNLKVTGEVNIYKLTEIRNPMAFIRDSWGNAPHPWPNGNQFFCEDHLQVDSADLREAATGVSANLRGWGPTIYSAISGSYYKHGLLLRNSKPNPSGKRGIAGGANSKPFASYLDVQNTVQAEWTGNEYTTIANTTKSWSNNIWDDAAFGTNVARASLPDGALKTAITDALAHNMHTTFRVTAGISVTVDADPLVTEDRVMYAMGLAVGDRLWNDLVRHHFNAEVIKALT